MVERKIMPSTGYISAAREEDWKYPPPKERRQGYLTVSREPLHRIHWREYGKAEGEPVMVLHGGPGGAALTAYARFFDPARYRIILFDQRGCGLSEPNAKDAPEAALAANTLQDLVADIARLRAALGLEGRMHLFGGSWGSSLALAYASEYPDTLRSLVLRGIFLCRKQDLDYFYQGNAAFYATDPNDKSLPGAYRFRPGEWADFTEVYPPDILPQMRQSYEMAWRQFVEMIPQGERADMVRAYARIFAATPRTPKEIARQQQAFRIWSVWEGVASFIAPALSVLDRFADPDFAPVFARIENHYFNPDTGAFPPGNYLLGRAGRIVKGQPGLPIYIVQGKYDQVCPRFQADALVTALADAGAKRVYYILTEAGHSCTERRIMLALTRIMDEMPAPEG